MDKVSPIAEVLMARFIVDALLEDYAHVVCKLDGTSVQDIKQRIKEDANKRLLAFTTANPPREQQ
jgi:hypothetical protein